MAKDLLNIDSTDRYLARFQKSEESVRIDSHLEYMNNRDKGESSDKF